MKNDVGAPPDEPAASTGVEPVSPVVEEQAEQSKERDLDELRRFRVRTVPPDMRRQWMLAETPVVSTLELQDTLPPNKRPSNAPPDPNVKPPQPLFRTPRVSSTAPTRRLTPVVPRDERALTLAATAVGLAFAVVLIGFVWRGIVSKGQDAVSRTPVSESHEPGTASDIDKPLAPQPVRAETQPAPVVSQAARAESLETSPKPAAKTPRPQTEPDDKLPSSTPAASGKIPPAQKPRPESDIKRPLFGK